MNDTWDYIIVGAGISGLLAADTLSKEGLNVLVLDKSRGVGGRMARRYKDDFVWDHGAQYVRINSDVLQSLLSAWCAEKLFQSWFEEEGREPAYKSISGMTILPKSLASSLNLRLNTRISSIKRYSDESSSEKWQLTDTNNNVFWANHVIVSSPVPQALEILSNLSVEAQLLANLKELTYWPCLAMLVSLNKPSLLKDPGYERFLDHPILGWITDNKQKGISKEPCLTVHASPRWSETHFEADESDIISTLTESIKTYIPDKSIEATQLVRWRYSLPKTNYTEPFCIVNPEPRLILVGDAFGGSKVQGAMLSGLKAAEWILKNR